MVSFLYGTVYNCAAVKVSDPVEVQYSVKF